MNRAEKAVELKHNGYNCAQAVLASYADILPIDAESLKKLGAAFGVGMGTRDTVCGALAAAQMILGLVKYEVNRSCLRQRSFISNSKISAEAPIVAN